MRKSQIEKVKIGSVFVLSCSISIYGIVTNIIWRTRTSALVYLKFCDADGNIESGEIVMTLSKLIRLNNL